MAHLPLDADAAIRRGCYGRAVTVTPAERRSFREDVGPLLQAAVRALAAVDDPAELEVDAGGVLPRALVDGPVELLEEALELVAETPGGGEVLAALSASAPPMVALRAREGLAELEAEPRALGALTPIEAWELDAGEPVTALTVLCRREGLAGHQLFSFVIEAPLSGGAIKDGFASGELRDNRLLEGLLRQARKDGVEPESVDPAEAAARVVAAARRGAEAGYAPTPDGLVAASIFLRNVSVEDPEPLLQALALSPLLADAVEELEEEARGRQAEELAVVVERWARDQGREGEEVEQIAWAAQLMGDFRAHYVGGDVYAWRRDDVDELLLDWVPRKVSLSEPEIETLPGSVSEVLRFLGAAGRLPEPLARSLSRRAEWLAGRFAAAARDPSNFGPAKAITTAMMEEGVELTDRAAVAAWIDDFNARPQFERDVILGPSLPLPATPRRSRPGKARKAQRQARRRNRRR